MPAPPLPSTHPNLTPSLCFSTSTLRAFLRLSRSSIDDPIAQHLSALSHPSTRPFDTSDLSRRSSSPSTSMLDENSCAGFVGNTLFAAWKARERVLDYCAAVAEQEMTGNGAPTIQSPLRQRTMRMPSDMMSAQTELEGDPERVVDERLDPYSARDYQEETRGERLARVLREEKAVETIVRGRSWGVVRDRCGGREDWMGAMTGWEGKREGR